MATLGGHTVLEHAAVEPTLSSRSTLDIEASYRSPESFVMRGSELVRLVRRSGNQKASATVVGDLGRRRRLPTDASAVADLAWLRAKSLDQPRLTRSLRAADLFSGCGAMSLGVAEAARALHMEFRPLLSCDISATAQAVYADNFGVERCPLMDLNGLSSLIESTLTPFEITLTQRIDSQLDILLAGPPCQGHSNLNNYTRRKDPKNGLYFKIARFAKLFAPRCIIIENVATVTRDSGNVVPRTMNELTRLGYHVEVGTIDLSKLGVPQARKRHVLIAARGEYSGRVPSIRHLASVYSRPLRTVAWALKDLLETSAQDLFNSASAGTAETQRRIDHLFDNELFDLPDKLRPDCHRTKDHTYRAVYGRMNWNAPAPTITGGFCTMGQGRFVHPLKRRTLTPHEAARLQMIPDRFSFAAAQTRKSISELIGNAVPPKLSYVAALELFR